MDNIEIIDVDNIAASDILSGVAVKPAKVPFYTVLLNVLEVFFHDLGKSICEIISDLSGSSLYFTGRFIGYLWIKTEDARAFLLCKLKYAGFFLISPILKRVRAFSRMRRDVRTAMREKGLFSSVLVFFKHFFGFLFGKHGAAVTAFNYAAPVISIIFLVNVISYATEMNYAVRIEVNGKFVGYIENELVFTEAQKIFEQRSAALSDVTPRFTIEKVGYSEIFNSYKIADILLEQSGFSVDNAYGVVINDTFIGAVKDNSSIIKTLESLLDAQRTGAADEEVSFEWDISCTQSGLYTVESIIDPQIIIRNITRKTQEAQFYTVEDGDSHTLIGDKLNKTQAELELLNPGFSELNLAAGQEIMYSADVPYLPVSVTRTEIYEEYISFDTEYRDDDTLYKGTSKTYIDGEDGLMETTSRVTIVNGVEKQRVVQSAEILSEPVTKIILRGTKPLPTGAVSTDSASYGKFIWPVARGVGKVSEWGYWDGGYYGHSGIDISAPYGTPIFAGDSGVVVLAGKNYGYGNCVIIEHANGMRTLYGHCSALNVKVGQVVTQGDNIGFVGATGTAYGNHVHFEVRQSGKILNPRYYLDF